MVPEPDPKLLISWHDAWAFQSPFLTPGNSTPDNEHRALLVDYFALWFPGNVNCHHPLWHRQAPATSKSSSITASTGGPAFTMSNTRHAAAGICQFLPRVGTCNILTPSWTIYKLICSFPVAVIDGYFVTMARD